MVLSVRILSQLPPSDSSSNPWMFAFVFDYCSDFPFDMFLTTRFPVKFLKHSVCPSRTRVRLIMRELCLLYR
jgi:hypothetical protein